MIVRDEEEYLEDCLLSARSFVDQIVVCDTGSRDRTPEISSRYADRVVESDPAFDFSVARNRTLALAEGEWILLLDADERLLPHQVEPLERTLASADDATTAFFLLRVNFLASGGFVCDYALRLVRNVDGLGYRGAIAESLLPAIDEAGGTVARAPFTVNHFGHWRPQSVRRAKGERYVALLTRKRAEHPEDAVLEGKLALTLKTVGRLEEAFAHTHHALGMRPDLSMTHAHHAHMLRALDMPAEALDEYLIAAELGSKEPPRLNTEPSNHNLVGVMQLTLGLLDEAQQTLEEAYRETPWLTHILVNQGLVAQARGDHDEAATLFRRVGEANPGFMQTTWRGRLEPDPFQHLDSDTIMRFAGLPYHLAFCERQAREAGRARPPTERRAGPHASGVARSA